MSGLRFGGGDFDEIIGATPSMERVFEVIRKVARTSSSVLITGESGTGKELAARAIHYLSDRSRYPFIAVNCAAIPSGLIESEFFGHEMGSFTGATARKIGKFEHAGCGTVFFDEIVTLAVALQSKLLRVLQERSFERVGGNREIRVNARIIAATNANIEKVLEDGLFRADLYYRLNTIPLKLPPLRERKDALEPLLEFFVRKHAKKSGKSIRGFSSGAIEALKKYGWPGNVRELENAVERLVVFCKDGAEITEEDFPAEINSSIPPEEGSDIEDFKSALRGFEKNYIIKALDRTGWKKTLAANLLKVHRNTLLYKMRALGIRQG